MIIESRHTGRWLGTKRVLYCVGLTCGMLGAGYAAAGITITPASHDYGKAPMGAYVGGPPFDVTVPLGAGPNDTLTSSVMGPHASEFQLTAVACKQNWRSGSCIERVFFTPSSVGQKLATLVVEDTRGNRATAQLKGEGVGPVCKVEVVSCNYAHLYSGTFAWNSGLQGPGSQSSEHVQVDIANGVANCNGAATSTFQGKSRTAAITGNGLVAVEFVQADTSTTSTPSKSILVYRITVACPTPAWPPGSNGEPASPSEPAELGHNDRQSYDQPATGPGANLVGSYTNPAPETDQLNGVTGNVSVRWEICSPARYVLLPGQVGKKCT